MEVKPNRRKHWCFTWVRPSTSLSRASSSLVEVAEDADDDAGDMG